jgi:transposase-like protein
VRTRRQYDEALKNEIARGWYYRTLTSKEIEARGVQMANVYRWMADIFGPGPRPPKGTTPPPLNGAEKSSAASTPAAAQLLSLSKRKIKRGANGRYPDEVREAVETVLLDAVPVPEVSEQTGINAQTLYNWKESAKKKQAKGESRTLVALPDKPIEPAKLSTVRKAEILVNPDSKEQLLKDIRRNEAFVNFEKVVKRREAQYRAGLIDFDEDDHRLAMSYCQLVGGTVRGVRKIG